MQRKIVMSCLIRSIMLLGAFVIPACAVYAQESSPNEYIEQLKQAQDIHDSIDLYYNIGYWYSFDGNDTAGDRYTYSAIELSKRHHFLLDEAKGYYLVAEKFSYASNNDSAGYYAQRSIDVYNTAGKRQVYYVHALNILASIALENADAAKATELAEQQMEVATELNDTASLSSAYMLLSAIHESLNDMEKAIAYSQRSLELDKASGVMYNTSQSLCNLAMLYMDENRTSDARPLLYEALYVSVHDFPSGRDRGIAQMYLGQYHHQVGQEDSAYWYFDKAKKIIEELGEPDLSMRLSESFAEVCRLTGRYDTALAYINKSIAIAHQHDILDHYALGLSIRSGILADMGNYHEAYDQYKEYSALHDSLSGAEVQKTIAGLEEKYESDKKDERIEQEKENNRLLTGGLLVVLLLAVLVLIQYIRQRAANKTIQQQSDKLTMLMKELHHRVKNNLQIISSLLSLQSFRIKDRAASKAVRDGQQRIEAMSLIHQRLYTRDNITEINIREFISDLVDSLQSAYGFGKDSITIKLDIQDELMNVDQAIPLSLIVNELVTNAFKYAYEDNDKPELTIRLTKDKTGIYLVVADNGKGVNIDEWKDKEGSFGKELIQTFVQQLNGELSLKVDNGTQFNLYIPAAA